MTAFSKLRGQKGEVPSAFCPFAPVGSVLVLSQVGHGRYQARISLFTTIYRERYRPEGVAPIDSDSGSPWQPVTRTGCRAIGRMGIQTGSRPGAVQIASTLRPTARGFDKGVNPVISVVHSLTAAVIVNNFVMECMMPSKSALNGLLYVSKAWQRAMCEASQLAVNVVFARKLSRSHYA